MLRQALLCVAFLALGHSSPAALAATAPKAPDPALAAAASAAQKEDCSTALKIVAEQAAARGFSNLPDETRSRFFQIGFFCAWKAGQTDLSLRYIEAATGIAGAAPQLWQTRFGLQWNAKKQGEAIATVEIIARDMPEALNTMDAKSWFFVAQTLKNSNPDLRRRLLKVLANPAFVPAEPGISADSFREAYAVILAESGDQPGAAALIALIDEPRSLKRISLDPRLRAAIPAQFDARAAVERHMARMREVAAAHARAIRPQLLVAQYLLMLDRAEEALATLEAISPEKAGADGFADQADQLNWWWDAKARAYALLGRYGDAVLAYSQGKAIAEGTFPNISQTINMSEVQLRFGHPADALITLAPIAAGKVSGTPYGLMQFRKNHGCASFRTGAIDTAKADLAFMTEHVADAPAALTSLQLCMGDIPAAAASTIRRLDRPDERVEALIDLSDYTDPPPTYPKDPDATALAAIKARTDVQAAIARAGETRKFNISP